MSSSWRSARARIVDSLPSEFPVSEAHPPEGDPHYEAKGRTREVLGSFFSRIGRAELERLRRGQD